MIETRLERVTMALVRVFGYPELILDSTMSPYYCYRTKIDGGTAHVVDGFCSLYSLESSEIAMIDQTLEYLQAMVDSNASQVNAVVQLYRTRDVVPRFFRTPNKYVILHRCKKHCIVSLSGKWGDMRLADEAAEKMGYSVPYGYDSHDSHLWCPDCRNKSQKEDKS